MLNMSVTTQAPPDADLQAFSTAMEEFGRAQRRVAGRFNRAPTVPELSKAQYLLLEGLLHEDAEPCVGQLAEDAGVSAPTATRMLDGLVRRGVVERHAGAGDRRTVHVALTAHGRALVEAKRTRVLTVQGQIFAQLTETERRGAARLLTRLAAAIEELQP